MAINLTPEQEQDVLEVKEGLQVKVNGADDVLDTISEAEETLNQEESVYELYQDNVRDIRDRYETERHLINRYKRSDDVTQSDLNQWLSHQGRLHGNDETLFIQEPIRIPAMDWPPNPIEEPEWELASTIREAHIKAMVQAIALGGNNVDMGLYDDVDATSVTFRVQEGSGFVAGQYGVLDTGSDMGIFKVISVTAIPYSEEVPYSAGPPEVPYQPEVPATDLLEVEWLQDIILPAGIMPQTTYSLKPQGVIQGNESSPPAVVRGGVSFGNTERTNKTHPRVNYTFQVFLNYVRAMWNHRLYYAQSQLIEFNANLHDLLDDTYKTSKLEPFVNNIQQVIADDLFTDAVLNPLWVELTTRDTDANNRVTEITNQLEVDVYDKIFQFYVFRLNKMGGPFYKLDKLEQARQMVIDQQARDNLALNSI